MPAVTTSEPRGGVRQQSSSSLGALLEALHAAELPDEDQPADHTISRDSPGHIPASPATRPIHHTLGRPLQVLLRFRMDGPLQPQMADVIGYINTNRRDLVVALPPDLPVRPQQQGEIHLLSSQKHQLAPLLFTVKSIEPGSMLTLAVLELHNPF